jgi:hypothetical protein
MFGSSDSDAFVFSVIRKIFYFLMRLSSPNLEVDLQLDKLPFPLGVYLGSKIIFFSYTGKVIYFLTHVYRGV